MLLKKILSREKTEKLGDKSLPVDSPMNLQKGRMSIELWDEWLHEAEKNLETYMWIVMGVSSFCFAGIILSLSL